MRMIISKLSKYTVENMMAIFLKFVAFLIFYLSTTNNRPASLLISIMLSNKQPGFYSDIPLHDDNYRRLLHINNITIVFVCLH